jgi:hypothetical protein
LSNHYKSIFQGRPGPKFISRQDKRQFKGQFFGFL